jgi:hypothetical protein
MENFQDSYLADGQCLMYLRYKLLPSGIHICEIGCPHKAAIATQFQNWDRNIVLLSLQKYIKWENNGEVLSVSLSPSCFFETVWQIWIKFTSTGGLFKSLRSSIFWDIKPCGLLKVNRRFGGTYRLYLQGLRIREARCVPAKRRLTFNGLQGIIS